MDGVDQVDVEPGEIHHAAGLVTEADLVHGVTGQPALDAGHLGPGRVGTVAGVGQDVTTSGWDSAQPRSTMVIPAPVSQMADTDVFSQWTSTAGAL